jgi:uncharacterized protein (TIGR03000 family)
MTLKKNLFVALAIGCALAMSANSASAHLFGHGSCGSSGGSWGGGSHGSWGSHGGSWGGSYGSCGSSGGGYGVSYGSGGSYGGGSCGGCSSCGSEGGVSFYGGYDGGYASNRITYGAVASAPAVKTSLTIHVPADAKISLAGVDTKQSGEARQFATTRLAAGQTWDNYKVVVEMEKNGRTMHEERTIKLIGGEAQELSINFDSTSVAKN